MFGKSDAPNGESVPEVQQFDTCGTCGASVAAEMAAKHAEFHDAARKPDLLRSSDGSVVWELVDGQLVTRRDLMAAPLPPEPGSLQGRRWRIETDVHGRPKVKENGTFVTTFTDGK